MKNILQKGLTPLALIVVCVVLVAVTFIVLGGVNQSIDTLEREQKQLRLEQVALEAERSAYENELSRVETDAYVIRVAREKYGYIMPGEIRFHISNIDDLYGVHEVTAEDAP